MPTRPPVPFSLFIPPYRELIPLDSPEELFRGDDVYKGAALVWQLGHGWSRGEVGTAERRSPGMALIMVLPPADDISPRMDLVTLMEETRPQSILPYHREPDPEDLVTVLGRLPRDLPMEFVDYLAWRGLTLDRDTRHLVRKTVELSSDLRTVNGLARSVYLSRRALGRRFLSRGLPVPSHWLQFARVLRASLMLQSKSDSLFQVACDLGYPDGFALSNQMKRLTGVRPSLAKECLGWEWITECWLRKERDTGGLKRPLRGPEMDSEPTAPRAARRASDPPSMRTTGKRRSSSRPMERA